MKYWVFDLDGTLVDSHSVYFNSLRKLLESYDVSLSESDEQDILRTPVKERVSFFAKKVGAECADEALRLFEIRILQDDSDVEVFDGIVKLLEKLIHQDKKIALWTARDMNSARRVIHNTGLSPYFSFFMSGTCVSNCKPAPEGLLRIAQAFDCDPTALVMVGDHDNDMLAARACGAKAIRALWNDPSLDCELSDHQFTQVGSLTHWLPENPV